MNVVYLQERQAKRPPNPIAEALAALALALTDHGHVWTERERQLYETALDYLEPRRL